ncbi:diguanylate cyclase [bacterium]|nr:diguanylate cyclase [bacterium]
MKKGNILIFNPNAEERKRLDEICRRLGNTYTSDNLEKAISLLESTQFNVVLVDHSLGHYSSLKGLFNKKTSIIITGTQEEKIKEIAREWPWNRYVAFSVITPSDEESNGFMRTLQSAVEHSFLKTEVDDLTRSLEHQEIKLHRAFSEINDVKNFIQNNVVKEREKRVAVEAKYIFFKKEKRKIENILKNLYTANDITTLLEIVSDIKEIVEAKGISIYILEQNETLGTYLKPLVWNDAVLSHPDISKHIVLLDSHDFAAFVARHSIDLNFNDLASDRRLSERYTQQLNYPLQNLLSVPITREQNVIGVLEVYNKTGKNNHGFSQEDQKILKTISEHISIAITKLNLIQYDALTGLLRPDPFFDKVIQKLKTESKRQDRDISFAMVMGDVDWFKNYNDRNGHEAGNKVLRELANVLLSSTREEDFLCRYGGEEFLFFLTGIKNVEEAFKFTERIRKNIEETYFENQEYQPRNNLTMSFGITFFTKERFDSLQAINRKELKKIANNSDMALSEAKGKKAQMEGLKSASFYKNKVSVYHPKTAPLENQEWDQPSKEKKAEERREFKRFYASTILIFRKNGEHKVSKTINISLGGAKIRTQFPLSPEQRLDLILILGNKSCKLSGDIVYSQEKRGDFYSGIKFKDLSATDKKLLQEYFSSLSLNNTSFN